MNIAEFYNFVVLAIINKIFALIVIVLQLIIGVVTFTKVGFLNRSLKFVSKLVLVSKIFFLEILYIWFLNKMLTICWFNTVQTVIKLESTWIIIRC